MLSGVKFIPREQVDKAEDENTDRLVDKKKNSSSSKTNKHRRQKKSSGYGSSDDDELERIEKRSRRKKKWYSSEESSSGSSSGSEDEGSSDKKRKKRKNRGKSRRKSHDSLEDEDDRVKEKLKRGKKKKMKNYLSDEYSSSSSEDEKGNRSEKGRRDKGKAKSCEKPPRYSFSDDENQSGSLKDLEIVRKEMGLDWMLRPADRPGNKLSAVDDNQPYEPPSEEIKVNPRELNPYLKDNGTGYPDEGDLKRSDGDRLQSSSIVGDGGASWRLKALKRAQEQASREGRNLEEVVGERWGSLGQLTVSVASHRAAPYRAHLHAIRGRKRGLTDEDGQTESDAKKNSGRDYLKDVSARHPEMRAPKINDSLSWGKRKSQNTSSRDAGVISAAASSMNKFVDDGSFLSQFVSQQSNDSDTIQKVKEKDPVSSKEDKHSSNVAVANETLSANQLAAKALQLRLKGQHEVAEKLMQEAQNVRTKQSDTETLSRQEVARSVSRHVISQHASARRREEDDSDRHLAKQIMQNKQYSLSGRADDEYDFEDGPRKKPKKKNIDDDRKVSGINNVAKRILTQQERCLFCFENPNRPKHLVVSIANTTYLMLPQWEAVVPGHCCIVTMQHEASTRTVDDNVREEIRNFKKCLIMMFAKQEKEVVFLETVMRLAQQRRHCLIECIPLPQEVAKQAPLYFKKAIDEAEEEWSQHNAKKLIDTSVKGLRGSIPKGFPYFHVEFGLNRGFVHVIDDEEQFKSSLGLNVIRGMLQLPEEDMFRRRRYKSFEVQKQAVASFARDWEPFDWTKQLD